MIGGHIPEEIERGVVVEHAVHPSVGKELRIVDTREGEHAVKEIRTAKEYNGGVESAETAPGSDGEASARVLAADEGNDLIDDVGVVLLLAARTPRLIAPDVRPRFRVDGIHAEELNAPARNVARHRLDHAEVLEVVAHRVLRREYEDGGGAPAPVDADVHHAVEARAVPVDFFAVYHKDLRAFVVFNTMLLYRIAPFLSNGRGRPLAFFENI